MAAQFSILGPVVVIALLALRPICGVSMGISKRMKLIPYEALVGLTSTIVAVVIYVIAG